MSDESKIQRGMFGNILDGKTNANMCAMLMRKGLNLPLWHQHSRKKHEVPDAVSTPLKKGR